MVFWWWDTKTQMNRTIKEVGLLKTVGVQGGENLVSLDCRKNHQSQQVHAESTKLHPIPSKSPHPTQKFQRFVASLDSLNVLCINPVYATFHSSVSSVCHGVVSEFVFFNSSSFCVFFFSFTQYSCCK